ncbi:MAG: hypothetical protein LBQ14_07365 [Treponema sp.]|nr:hypothetical protein [Treponema sp.]
MKAKKTALIVTDGTGPVHEMAERIAAALTGFTVTLRAASGFAGTDMLPADICFFGCAVPRPASFAYLEELLQHINLAGRPCGIFSPGSKEAAAYLARMVHDSELALNPEPLLEIPALTQWVARVIKQG